MFHSLSRTAAVAVVTLALVLSFVPAAQAASFGFGPSVETRSAGWLDLAWSWLSGLLFGEGTSSPRAKDSTVQAATSMAVGGGYVIQSGGCIDPEGRPRPSCF